MIYQCCGLAFALLFFTFGLLGLVKAEIPLVGKRKIAGPTARIIGIILIVVGLLELLRSLLVGVR